MGTAAAEAATTTETTTETGAQTEAPVVVPDPAKAAEPVEYALKLSDQSAFTAADLDGTIALARESGLSPEAAQKVLTHFETATAEKLKTGAEAERDAFIASYDPGDPATNKPPGAEFQRLQTEWQGEALADPELGNGDQAKLDAKVAKAQQAFTKFASPAFVDLLASTGYGSHPEVVRVFAKIGEAMGEQPPVTSSGQTPGRMSDAEVFFGKKE